MDKQDRDHLILTTIAAIAAGFLSLIAAIKRYQQLQETEKQKQLKEPLLPNPKPDTEKKKQDEESLLPNPKPDTEMKKQVKESLL